MSGLSGGSPVPPAARLRPGGPGMTVGIVAPELDAFRTRKMIRADWRVIDSWDVDRLLELQTSCQVILVPEAAETGKVDHLLGALQDAEASTPPVLVQLGATASPPSWVHLYDGTWRGEPLQEALLDLVVAPFFDFLSEQVRLAMDSEPALATLFADVVRRRPPPFARALELDQAGLPTYVRYVKDVELVSTWSRSHLSRRATEADVPLGWFLVRNALLHGVVRWIPGTTFRYRLARRLHFQTGDSLERAVRRVTGKKIAEVRELELAELAVKLLGPKLPALGEALDGPADEGS